MKKIGVIGGLSWVSTAVYYRRLNELAREKFGGVSSAHLIIESVNRELYVDAVIKRRDESAACDIIRNAALSVQAGGAEFIVISCNDVHRFVPEVAPLLNIPFLHIADVTAASIADSGIDKVALMGVRKTMEEPFYTDILKQHGIETIILDEAQKTFIHDTIYNEMVHDNFTEQTQGDYINMIETFKSEGAQGVVLGCTEIPILLAGCSTAIDTFSTSELHCRAAIEMAAPSVGVTFSNRPYV